MPILLPVAGLSISLVVLLVVGGVVGSLSGLFGVGGGFLITPILMMIGIPPTVAAASGSCQMVATSSSGMAAHSRLGNVDFKMGAVLLAGGLVGADLGVRAIRLLRTLGEADLAITLAYVLVLGSLGSYMFFQSLATLRRGAVVRKTGKGPQRPGVLDRLPWQMDFPRSGVRHSVLVPLSLAVIVGVLAAIMGVGGGFIMIPMMIYLLAMPTHVAVGTSLFQILFLCAGVTYLQAATNQTVDLLLVLPLALGSAVGAQAGARLGRLLRGEQLIILLATLVLAVTGKMISDLVFLPSNRLKPAEMYRREEASRPPRASPRRLAFYAPPLGGAGPAAGVRTLPGREAGKLRLAPLRAHANSAMELPGKEGAPLRARAAAPGGPLRPAGRERNNSPPGTALRTTAWPPGCSYTYRAGCSRPSAAPECRASFPSPRSVPS
jgi:uncharacterized protein